MSKQNTVTQEMVDNAIKNIQVMTVKEKCTLVIVELKNGFILTESSACVDKANYDEKLGVEIALGKIKDKIWELEGYKLQCELNK
ncbi:MAG: hypothetical protein PWP31_1809 [Clostridia bacterium]|jgi:hypothetical protein|nr:hypothetical protein [Clostridia bacterium]